MIRKPVSIALARPAAPAWRWGEIALAVLGALGILALFFMAADALAQTQPTTQPPPAQPPAAPPAAAPKPVKPVLNGGDTAWMIVASALVLLMTIPGVALFYGGMVRKKNVLSVVMHVFAICCVVSILWVVIGYSLTFSGEGKWIGNAAQLFLGELTGALAKVADSAAFDKLKPEEQLALMTQVLKQPVATDPAAFPMPVWVMFQMTFAIITPALIVGAYVDRMKFAAMLVFIALWSLLVYAPVGHWVWGGGWLTADLTKAASGALDFAGGTVVHINAGIAGLVCAIVLGKRVGYGTENMAPHNLVLSVVGAALLWVGWFGFNAGSAFAASGQAGMAMLTTHLATAVAALTWTLIELMVRGKASILGIVSGAVAGLVAITPAAGFVGVLGAIVIGAAAGVICYWACTSLKKMFKYDDALDVFGVHAVGGIVGAILTGVFAREVYGGTVAGAGGTFTQVLIQVKAVAATIAWSGVVTFVILMIVKAVIGLRVTTDQEREGLDLAEHGETVH
jgi:Amt family ammonium transporter